MYSFNTCDMHIGRRVWKHCCWRTHRRSSISFFREKWARKVLKESKTHGRPKESSNTKPPPPELHSLSVKIKAGSPSSHSLSFLLFSGEIVKKLKVRWVFTILRSPGGPSRRRPNTERTHPARPALFWVY